jgi:hypothetical protein
VLPDPDGEPARRGELRVGVTVATGDAAELRTPPAGVGLGEVAVSGGRSARSNRMSSTYNDPDEVNRRLATLDLISGGRAAGTS